MNDGQAPLTRRVLEQTDHGHKTKRRAVTSTHLSFRRSLRAISIARAAHIARTRLITQHKRAFHRSHAMPLMRFLDTLAHARLERSRARCACCSAICERRRGAGKRRLSTRNKHIVITCLLRALRAALILSRAPRFAHISLRSLRALTLSAHRLYQHAYAGFYQLSLRRDA